MPAPMTADADQAARMLDAALTLAEAHGSWEALRLREVADALGLSLADVRARYAQKDALAEAWFDRADRAALQASEAGGFAALPVSERLERVLLAWLDALHPHRRLTRGMLAYKLEPGHLHLQLPGIARVSRTVQWFREAAGIDSRGVRRVVEETALTLLYLRTFAYWLYDETPGSQRTRDWLTRTLRRQGGCLARDVVHAPTTPARAAGPPGSG